MVLTTELRVSREPHSGSAPPQPLNKSKTEEINSCSFPHSFIGLRPLRPTSPYVSRSFCMHPHMRLQTVCNDFSSLCRLPPDQLCFRFGDQYEAALVDPSKEARWPADHEEGASRRRQRRRPHGRAAPERRRRRAREAVETLEEAAQRGERPEGNADVDRGQEAGKGSGCEEDGL